MIINDVDAVPRRQPGAPGVTLPRPAAAAPGRIPTWNATYAGQGLSRATDMSAKSLMLHLPGALQ